MLDPTRQLQPVQEDLAKKSIERGASLPVAFDHRLAARTLNARHLERGDFVCDIHSSEPKFYALGMFPYPSGNAHMGHVLVYSINDVRARLAKLEGYNVLNPLGWDAFGLPAENAARKHNVDPAQWTALNIRKMKEEQFIDMGWSFDPTKEISTCDPLYYANTQRLFQLLYRSGLAYQAEGLVNWDPVDQTALANEQVIDGKSWRSGATVEKKWMTQWFLSVTPYNEKLYQDIETLTNWPESARAVQRHWIGRKEGTCVDFALTQASGSLKIFTTRVDTIFGVTAVVIGPEHPLARSLAAADGREDVRAYIESALKRNAVSRTSEPDYNAIDTGLIATNPLSGEKVSVWIASYVLGDVGMGAIMCVPAHDERDRAFAKHNSLPIVPVVQPAKGESEELFANNGILNARCGRFAGLSSEVARQEITAQLKAAGLGDSVVTYNLRDWSVGRQRFWGCAIPIVYCDDCGTHPVPDEQLPVMLPPSIDQGGRRSLADIPEFVNTTCPCCGKAAKRETDTLDTFVCSSWYAFRFLDPHNNSRMFDPEIVSKWMPLDYYVGNIEHAAQHMIYFRYITKVLHAQGLLASDEPVKTFFCNGLIKKDGSKMSKSRGNVVVPTEMVAQYGGDALRIYVLSDTPAAQDREWEDRGLEAKSRFVSRCYQGLNAFLTQSPKSDGAVDLTCLDRSFLRAFYGTAERLRQSIRESEFHSGIARLYELSRTLLEQLSTATKGSTDQRDALREVAQHYLIIASAFMPYMTETIFAAHFDDRTGIYNQRWPSVDSSLVQAESVPLVVQFNGKKKLILEMPKDATESEVLNLLREDPEYTHAAAGRTADKVFLVKNRLINLVFK